VVSQARDRDPANPLVRLENGGIVKPLLIGLQGVKNEFQRTPEYTYWLWRFHILCSWPVPLSNLTVPYRAINPSLDKYEVIAFASSTMIE
jgi:hypothetical protein